MLRYLEYRDHSCCQGSPHRELEMIPRVSGLALRNPGVIILKGGVIFEVTSWRIAALLSHYFAWKCVVSFRQVFWRREKAQQSFFFLRYFDLKGCLMVGCVC